MRKLEGNPYSHLVKEIQKLSQGQQTERFRFGTVVNIDPLRIETSGTIQTSKDLLRSNTVTNLYKGDSVLLLPIEDEQRFIIICKVVSM